MKCTSTKNISAKISSANWPLLLHANSFSFHIGGNFEYCMTKYEVFILSMGGGVRALHNTSMYNFANALKIILLVS